MLSRSNIFSQFKQLDNILVNGKNQKRKAQGIGNPTEAQYRTYRSLTAGKHVEIDEGHQQRQNDKLYDYAEKIQKNPLHFRCKIL
jgi:hypothetical protein